MNKDHASTMIYDDGTYQVSQAMICTPTRLYPVPFTTARIRRDPLWLGGATIMMTSGAVSIYRDLLFPQEIVILIGVGVGALIAGSCIAILRIDAIGHPKAMIVARTGKIRALFAAIRVARTSDRQMAARHPFDEGM